MLTVPTWINGSSNNQISSLDRGLLYGDGVFETITVINGKPLLLSLHLKRLEKACVRLSIPVQLSLIEDELDRFLSACCQGQKPDKAILKLIVTRGCGGRGYNPSTATEPVRILQWHDFPDNRETFSQEGVSVIFCKTLLAKNPALAGIKHLNRLEQVLARSEWSDSAIQEGLMFDTDGHLIEGTMSNVFLVHQGALLTPELKQCGIEGVMREHIVALAKKLGIACSSATISRATIEKADEVFLTNCVIGIWPVKQINQKTYMPGSVTRLLQKNNEF